jgi:multidrug efflux pump subunit AcrB
MLTGCCRPASCRPPTARRPRSTWNCRPAPRWPKPAWWPNARARRHGGQGIKAVFSSIGGGSSGDAFAPGAAAEARSAVLTLTTVHRTERKESMAGSGSRNPPQAGRHPGRPLQGRPAGQRQDAAGAALEDPVALKKRRKGRARTAHAEGVGNVRSTASLVRPEIIVKPDFAKAADLGVTAAAIGETVRVATAGDYDTDLTKMNLPERQVPIRVKLPDAVRADLDAIGRLTVPGKNGPVLLATVARSRWKAARRRSTA